MPRPDFGMSQITHESGGYTVDLECRNIAPGLTLHDLTMIFENAKNEAGPSDHLSGNPSLWPDVRGVRTVTEAILQAVYVD